MAVALEILVKQLTDSGIIAAGKLENFVPPKASPKDGEELLRELHKQNLLTKFQAQQVAANRIKSLILGEYLIVDRIGAGGMGQVFKAEHRKMKRKVAVKMLPAATMKDAVAIARFEREVEAAAKLRHPNIVAADDAGQSGAVHFLVMEYVEGSDLSALVKKNGPFPVAKAVNYILQAARGLEYAHSESVIHRDIKPANLLLDKKGVVKILDMGLARIETDGNAATQAELTQSGTIMGSVDYMAPEQGMSTKSADSRADIYSLGCSLYYLIAGKATYDGETMAAKLVAHHNNPIPDLRTAQPDVSEELQAVFQKMVAKKIEDRYQSMTEVIADLERLGAGQQSSLSIQQSASTNLENSALTFLKDMPIQQTVQKSKATKKVAAVKSSEGKQPPWKNTKVLIGAGAAGFLCLLLGVIVIVRNKDGKEVARLEVADGNSVEVQPTTPATPATKTPAAPATSTPQPVASFLTASATPSLAKAPFDAATAKIHQAAWAKYLGTEVETTNSVGMKMVLIPPGEFMMGSTDEQVEAALKVAEAEKADQVAKDRIQKAERPQHRVVITKPFLMGATEVTVGQFKEFSATGYQTEAENAVKDSKAMTYLDPGHAVTDDSAAVLSWNDAAAYCKWLSQEEDATYRLPTEAEWEFACRAGTTTAYSFGDDVKLLGQYGCYNRNASDRSHAVGGKLPNGFGLHDMHGNLNEWCQDFYSENWYAVSPPNDPNCSSAGFGHAMRGGYHGGMDYICRSTFRLNGGQANLSGNGNGFRIVREIAAPSTTASVTPQPAVPAASYGKLFMHDPAFPQWMKDVQAMSAEKQIEAVSKKLMELNPGFDGKVRDAKGRSTPLIVNGVVTEIDFYTDNVTDISPVRVFSGLKILGCSGSNIGKGNLSDLSPLQGMSLSDLRCRWTKIADLSPLKGMRLAGLSCDVTAVSDLLPLQGMPLSLLGCGDTQVSDLSPLKGMPLINLFLPSTAVFDLSPIEDCKSLVALTVVNTKVTDAGVAALQKALPNCKVTWSDPAKTTAPTKPITNINDPAFQQWMKDVQTMPIDKQVEAVSKKLMELNPGFDGTVNGLPGNTTPLIADGKAMLCRVLTDNVTDISPLRAFPRLYDLNISSSSPGKGMVSDLSQLNGLPLIKLYCRNLSVSDLSPLEGMKLAVLGCDHTKVSDLSPLRGMPLASLNCSFTEVSDLTPLEDCKSLKTLDVTNTKVTPAGVAALQKALPNCIIAWDDPAKPTTPQPTVPAAAPVKPITDFNAPEFQAWMKEVQAMPAEEQVKAVSKKLMELNPGFDGVVTPKVEASIVTELSFQHDDVRDPAPVRALTGLQSLKMFESLSRSNRRIDLTPLRGMQLKRLEIIWGKFDMSPLQGMPLEELKLNAGSSVSDLSPLRGMPLKTLSMGGSFGDLSPLRGLPLKTLTLVGRFTDLSLLRGMRLTSFSMGGSKQIVDLTPLEGMPLTELTISTTGVVDLSPLKGLPLIKLNCSDTHISDLSPLEGCKSLQSLNVNKTRVTTTGVNALKKALPKCNIEWDDPQPVTTYNDPAFQQWMKGVGELPAEQQADAVEKKLHELNSDFKEKVTAKVENGAVIEIKFIPEYKFRDISPVKALSSLKVLRCDVTFSGRNLLFDLSPIQGLSLTTLNCDYSQVADLLPLKGMPLSSLSCVGTQITDLSPLQGMPLTDLLFHSTIVSELSPLAGMKLTTLRFNYTPVADLAPLKGMPLKDLTCSYTKVSDLTPLEDCKTLKTLDVTGTKVTAAGVAALQAKLPNCKITWDDPAKATTPQPAGSGTK